MKNKAFAVIVCLVLVAAMAIPGTLALSTDTDSSQTNATAEVPATPETPSETPAETLAPSEQPTEGTSEQPKQSTEEETPAPSETPKECTCDPKPAEGEAHKEGCPLYVAPEQPAEAEKTCTCGAAEGEAHKEGCPLYVAPEQPAEAEKVCTCDPRPADGEAHLEGCPLYGKPTEENPFKELYDKLMATASIVEFTEICAAYTDDDIAQFEKWVVENGLLDSLQSHIYAISPAPTMPETVVFTDAGPFMPPVTVERVRRRAAAWAAAADDSADTGNGLELKKEATANGDGTYTIRMEAYTTGTVTTTTSTVPVDIVLVLDQSGSMADDFNGNSRQYAMKQAVNSFIGAVNEKYDAEDADHRMAIVTFGSDAETLQGWTYVDTEGKNTLQGKINGLNSLKGATNAGAGMQQAEALMGTGYNYTGNNTKRQKVVVFFTDGVPTTSNEFSTDVANKAIAAAKNLKDGGATVYTVGIFAGANPAQLYGEKWVYITHKDIPCSGEVGSYWGGSWVSSIIGSNDFDGIDIAAGNRFLNYLSSNSSGATNIGLERGTFNPGVFFGGSGTGYKITENFDCENKNYYLTANDDTSLNNIFTTISQNIQTADISLDSSTVVKDIISPYFTAPADTNDIKVYTAAYQGGNTWGEDTPSSLSPTVNNSSVAVTGFDFNANFITENPKEDGTRGNKLVIEFTVAPKEGFLGGNNVPTNGADSGVYNKEGTVVGLFEQPTVNVPIPDVTVTAQDKNVYLLNDVTAEQLKTGSTVNVGNVELNLGEENYGLESWQTQYVEITVKVKDKDGNVIPTDGLKNLAEDTTYTIEVTVAPKTAGSITAKTGTSTPAAKINVFKPELTFEDSEVYYGADAPTKEAYDANNLTATAWKHGETLDTTVTMIGTAPELDLTYTPEGGKVNTKQDIAVDVAVKIGTDDVTDETSFVHTKCDETCTDPANGKFWIHVKTCTLSITKQGEPGKDLPDEPFVFTVYKDGVKYTEATIVGNDSVTICELPVGAYTIKEDTGWSWRYSANNDGSATLTTQNPTGTITCVNTKNNNQWLNGFSEVVRNIFVVTPEATN